MLDHPTHHRLRELKLDGMADAFTDLHGQEESADLSHAEWLGLLIDREAASRATRKFQSRMRAAKLRHVGASIEDVDYRTPRQLDRDLFRQLVQGGWIEKRQNLLVTGPCGVGKTWLACALGQKACRDGKSVLYHRLPRLFADLELAHGDGRFPRLFRQLLRTDLLILDDWGPDRLTPQQRRDLMESSGPIRQRLDHRNSQLVDACRRDRRTDIRRCNPRPARPQRAPTPLDGPSMRKTLDAERSQTR